MKLFWIVCLVFAAVCLFATDTDAQSSFGPTDITAGGECGCGQGAICIWFRRFHGCLRLRNA
ncbi:hypothetical protein SK128_009477 [Halocaridina rubra]|uniref:Uncharacterized protein n=1 Tax=Halocaridina rubra TaxID=373956 RepID=A0AAN9A4M9_HALRR